MIATGENKDYTTQYLRAMVGYALCPAYTIGVIRAS
jgi:hypothetical protein